MIVVLTLTLTFRLYEFDLIVIGFIPVQFGLVERIGE